MPLPQVQSKSGKMFDADSPQGRMIVNAPKQPFKADSPALLQTISADVGVIKDSVGLLVSIAQTDARGDALSAADVPHNVQDEAELSAVGLGGGGGDGNGGGGGGFFSKLFGGAGGILAGAGLLVGGFGALLAGGGVLLKEFNNFDGEKFKKNIEDIMSIVPSITSPGAALAFAADTGLFLVTMGTLGAGIALFGIGSAIGSTLESGLANFINPEWAQSIKDNVTTLLSISDIFGEDWKGKAVFIGESATFLAAMTTIGTGLAIFGLGSAVAGIGDGLNQGINHFTTKDWAQSIVDNVKTLLGISDLFGDKIGTALAKGGTFLVAMTTIGAGLAVFGAGSAVAGVADAVTSGIDKFGEKGWAQSIVDNVTTLLGINDLFAGFKDVLTEGGKFVVAMTAITAGLAVFSFGALVAGSVTGALDVTDWIARGEGMTWSQSIVDHVTTLLSIASLENIGADTKQFALTMAGISAGLVAFGVGSFFGAGADKLSEWISGAPTDFEGSSWSDKIKAKVMTLLSIVDPDEGGVTVRDATNFSLIMGKISGGLAKFAVSDFVGSILNAGSAAFDFLAGAKSPVQEMITLANSADDLEAGADALEKLEKSLNKISNLKFDGKSLKLKEFGEDLMNSLPYIENAIMGSRGQDLSWWPFYHGAQFEGLASPTIDYAGAAVNFKRLQEMGINAQVTPAYNTATQQLQDATSIMMTSDGPVTVINAPNNSINNSSGDTNYQEMNVDHDDKSGSWWSRVDLTPWN